MGYLLLKDGAIPHFKGPFHFQQKLQNLLYVLIVSLVTRREQDDVIKVYKAHVPSDSGEHDVKGLLKGFWCIAQSKRHSFLSRSTHVDFEAPLVAISFHNGYFSKAAVAIQL